ncbi:serpentine type 7TM GPCR chemoreceptor str domain-containing protein [Ditylenchus destructor]|nr:serpentine type 7TM GPCR chemoreceptor str domain-containing protein [Ditylenchus destructor]
MTRNSTQRIFGRLDSKLDSNFSPTRRNPVAISSTYGCYKNLRSNRAFLSQKTKDLYLTLTNALVIETFVGVCLVLVPLGSLSLAYQMGSKHGAIMSLLAQRTGSLYPLLSNVILLWIVKPYRKAVIGLFIDRWPSKTLTPTVSIIVHDFK